MTSRTGVLLLNRFLIPTIFGFLGALLFQVTQTLLGNSSKNQNNDKVSNSTIVSSQFSLMDTNGKVRAILGFSEEGTPGFWIMDDRGVARLSMGLYQDQSSHLGLTDKNGEMIQLMRSFGPLEAPLHIFKHEGRDRMILGLNSSQSDPFFISYDTTENRKTIYQGFADGP